MDDYEQRARDAYKNVIPPSPSLHTSGSESCWIERWRVTRMVERERCSMVRREVARGDPVFVLQVTAVAAAVRDLQ